MKQRPTSPPVALSIREMRSMFATVYDEALRNNEDFLITEYRGPFAWVHPLSNKEIERLDTTPAITCNLNTVRNDWPIARELLLDAAAKGLTFVITKFDVPVATVRLVRIAKGSSE